jgi:hypothetical protein
MMPDPAFYYDCLRASFEEICDASNAAVGRSGSLRKVAGD